MYKYLNLLMIPTDYCNMKCKYCFFDKVSQSTNKMSIETLRKIMDITLPYYSRVSFIWHGGEPLSMGLDFYKKVIEIQNEYSKKYNVKILNSIQSNLTLLTMEMTEFFVENNFGVSTSYDGINNELTRGNSKQILFGIEQIANQNRHCGTIMVASKLNIATFIESYLFFKERHIGFKINPYLGNDPKLKLDYSLYAEKMIELFNYWVFDTETDIQITSFNSIIDFILFHRKSICTYTSCVGKWASIDYNGTIKPCNRYFPDDYSYGNVYDYNSFEEAWESKGFRKLITQAIERRKKCKECEIFELCSGGCNYVAMTENGGISNNNGDYCRYLKRMYSYIKVFLDENQSNEKVNRYIKAQLKKLSK